MCPETEISITIGLEDFVELWLAYLLSHNMLTDGCVWKPSHIVSVIKRSSILRLLSPFKRSRGPLSRLWMTSGRWRCRQKTGRWPASGYWQSESIFIHFGLGWPLSVGASFMAGQFCGKDWGWALILVITIVCWLLWFCTGHTAVFFRFLTTSECYIGLF